MKKIIIALVVIIIGVGAWKMISSRSLLSNEDQIVVVDERSPEEILADDIQKITVNLKKENVETETWKEINNFSVSESQLVTKENAKEFFKSANANLPDIYSCLMKDFCGMTTRGEQDPYFDEQRTPAHILMNRNLQVMKEAIRKDPSLKESIDLDFMMELASSEYELLQNGAFEILKDLDESKVDSDDLMKMSAGSKGTAKANNLVSLSQKNGVDKAALLDKVKEVFASGDSDTVISVLERLKDMKLPNDQVKASLKNLCQFKDNEEEEHNWKMIRYEALKINKDFEKDCN